MLAKIVLTLTITFGAGHPTTTLDITPTFLVPVPAQILTLPGAHSPRMGLTVPYLSMVNESAHGTARRLTEREELKHADQWAALGPGFLVAYTATLGQPFEPYNTLNPPNMYTVTPATYNQGHMWTPPASMADSCPLLRFRAGNGHEHVNIAPCYVGLTVGN